MTKKKAFTLIELLVVIAIISLLVSILLPSLNKAKELARRVVCASNQRHILISCHLYAQDHSGKMPGTLYSGDDRCGTVGTYIYRQLAGLLVAPPIGWSDTNYVTNLDIFYCPNDETVVRIDSTGWGKPVSYPDGDPYSYYIGYMWHLMNRRRDYMADYPENWKISFHPSHVVLHCSGYNYIPNPTSYPWVHVDGKNVAYLGGHVLWYPRDAEPYASHGLPWVRAMCQFGGGGDI